ncbi:MAG TPA: hypothetical protein VK607_15690 [Kofleriaceae bacterium]|nr:hypothetical protein [Kofleriaceae bacterium]
MKKTNRPKRVLKLATETVRQLDAHDLPLVAGAGESNTYCGGCGTGTLCPQLKF